MALTGTTSPRRDGGGAGSAGGWVGEQAADPLRGGDRHWSPQNRTSRSNLLLSDSDRCRLLLTFGRVNEDCPDPLQCAPRQASPRTGPAPLEQRGVPLMLTLMHEGASVAGRSRSYHNSPGCDLGARAGLKFWSERRPPTQPQKIIPGPPAQLQNIPPGCETFPFSII